MLRPDPHDAAERLSADDQATRPEAEFLERALLRQMIAASKPAAPAGVCANCAEPCLPLAVYCDDECRADHEWRAGLAVRTGCSHRPAW